MTVTELIEKLMAIEDKTKEVRIGVDREITGDFDIIECDFAVNLLD